MAKRHIVVRITAVILLLLLIGAIIAWKPLRSIYFSGVPNDISNQFLLIPTGATFEQVVDSLQHHGMLSNAQDFEWLAEKMKYKRPEMRAGRFEIKPGWSNRELIKHLRAGDQAAVKVVLNNERLPEEVAGKISKVLEGDSLTFLQAFSDSAWLVQFGYTPKNLMTAFIPNTYLMYWNSDGRAFLKRMFKESEDFWEKNNRREKAQALGLSSEEVYTLASIVERETNLKPEKPTIAGVYLNRLRIGMPLQADPTAVFATRDFSAKRVTYYHTQFDSPYNTYLYKGLPPGPISMASISSLDAVLNPEQHDYLYFCAKPDYSGGHAFAATLQGHNVNVERFHSFLEQAGIR